MAKKLKSYRLDEQLLAEIDGYASERKVSATEVIEGAARDFLDLAKRGVPDLPVFVEPYPVAEPIESTLNAARVEYARGLAARQRGLNAGKERAR